MLDDRKRQILSALIEDFVLTAQPVGSKRLVEQYHWDISPATVRNELVLLEEMGYISQPHTSAGRIPTELGYRHYVDELIGDRSPSLGEIQQIKKFYTDLDYEISQLMRKTSHLLSDMTRCASLVYAPNIRKERIKHVDLVGLGGKKVMIVVITSSGSLSKQVVDLKSDVDLGTLQKLEAIINETLTDIPVDMVNSVSVNAEDLKPVEKKMLARARSYISEALTISRSERVYYDGAAYLLAKPEMVDVAQAHEAIELLERNYRLLEWMQIIEDKCDVMVSIGSENELNLEGFSLVASGYEVCGRPVGVLGVLGPTRMDYHKAISTVQYIAKNLGKVLAGLQS